ncbi:MAG: hypothetical protein R3E65_10505 [Steroidobacteraceae bacterium]
MSAPAFADPPPWAPAHGRRAKDSAAYAGYSGREWQRDYGVLDGRCNTEEVLTAVGAVAGGVIGNQIGDAIDDRDRACMGHSLELVGAGRQVEWRNPRTGVSYSLRPVRDVDRR